MVHGMYDIMEERLWCSVKGDVNSYEDEKKMSWDGMGWDGWDKI